MVKAFIVNLSGPFWERVGFVPFPHERDGLIEGGDVEGNLGSINKTNVPTLKTLMAPRPGKSATWRRGKKGILTRGFLKD